MDRRNRNRYNYHLLKKNQPPVIYEEIYENDENGVRYYSEESKLLNQSASSGSTPSPIQSNGYANYEELSKALSWNGNINLNRVGLTNKLKNGTVSPIPPVPPPKPIRKLNSICKEKPQSIKPVSSNGVPAGSGHRLTNSTPKPFHHSAPVLNGCHRTSTPKEHHYSKPRESPAYDRIKSPVCQLYTRRNCPLTQRYYYENHSQRCYRCRKPCDYTGLNRTTSNDYIDEREARRLFGSRHSLHNDHDPDQKWRPPDLPEVIEYLSHPNDIIKANAAAYLQHLCYGNHSVKSQTRALKGIPALVALLSHPLPEVHRNSLGALLNLSRGYENDDNKREIRSCGGLEKLTRLLETSEDNDVRELVSGILWNMSSLQELKKPVMNICLNTIVKTIVIPNTGLQSYTLDLNESIIINWSTEFRNATGVIRNLSSDGHYARKNLRECDGLIECLLRVAQAVIGRPEMDNKPVENVVCTLRNLSYRLMEIDYAEFYDKQRAQLTAPTPKRSVSLEVIPSCFGKSKQQPTNTIQYPSKTPPGRRRGEQLWQKEVVEIYLPLLSDCSNTDTLEAAVGAIQNLSACEWEPSMRIREHVRKQKGLPTVVELLGLEEADGVVCGAAIALRNLAIDKSNKTLIGKYAITQLVSRLPTPSADMSRTSEETVRAVLATLYEVFKDVDPDSGEHARTLVNSSDGLSRLIGISKSRMKYSAKTLKGTHHVLSALWRFSGLRAQYKSKGYKESDFLNKSMMPRPGTAGTMSLSSTLTRPRSEPPSNSNTINRNGTLRPDNSEFRPHNGNGRMDARPADLNQPYLERNPSTNTLPIQRPTQQPYEDQSYFQEYPDRNQPQYAGSYRHLETSHSYRDQFNQAHSYPDLTQPDANSRLQGYTNPALVGSFSQSREGLMSSGSYLQNADQAAQGEPLYARVDKRRSQTLENVSFSQPNGDPQRAVSLNSLNNQQTYSYQVQQDTSAADSWV